MSARQLLLLFSLLLCASPAVRADPSFGQTGELVPFGSVSISYQHFYAAGGNPSSQNLSFGGSPGLLYFVGGSFAVGTALDFDVESFSSAPSSSVVGTSDHVIGLAPTFAYNLWLGEHASLFPQLQLGFDYVNEVFSDNETVHSFMFKTALQLNLLFHPARHFFVGGGPSLVVRVYSASEYENRFTVGVGTIIGGWF